MRLYKSSLLQYFDIMANIICGQMCSPCLLTCTKKKQLRIHAAKNHELNLNEE